MIIKMKQTKMNILREEQNQFQSLISTSFLRIQFKKKKKKKTFFRERLKTLLKFPNCSVKKLHHKVPGGVIQCSFNVTICSFLKTDYRVKI